MLLRPFGAIGFSPTQRCATPAPKSNVHSQWDVPRPSPRSRPPEFPGAPARARLLHQRRVEVHRQCGWLLTCSPFFVICDDLYSAMMQICAPSAAEITESPSRKRHLPALSARQVAPDFCMVSIVFTPTTGTSKRMSWFGLAIFTTVNARFSVEASASSEDIRCPARSIVASVPSIASTATQAASAITTVCPMSYCARLCATPRPYSMFFFSCSVGARLVSTPAFANKGSKSAVEFSKTMPSSPKTFATAPSNESVLRVVRESSNFASRQSGRMLEKICLCLTCPAITARVTPSFLKVSIRRESSPSDSQCTAAAPRDSISGKVSSLIAATTTSNPCAFAASRTRNGNFPFPAMRPSFFIAPHVELQSEFLQDNAPQLGRRQLQVAWLCVRI